MKYYGSYAGYTLYASDLITKKVQRRSHRKRRINKKWRKRYGYKYVLDHGKVLLMGDSIFATPKTIEKLITAVMEMHK